MRRTTGFSLVEISIVLAVLSVVLSGLLPYMTESTKSEDMDETITRLDEIEEALIAYYIAKPNGEDNPALPCPSSLTVAIDNANFGDSYTGEGPTNRCATGGNAAPASLRSGNVVAGGVPVKALDLPDEYAFDGWGRRILYVVDARATGSTGANASDWASAGGITVEADGGDVRSNVGVFALISHGPNGHGGYTRSGTRVNSGSTNDDEAQNCDISGGPSECNNAFDATFVKKMAQYDVAGNVNEYFDDIVRYKDKRQVERVLGAMADSGLWTQGNQGAGAYLYNSQTGENVAIGTNNEPAHKLHVEGTTNITGNTDVGGQLDVSGTSSFGDELSVTSNGIDVDGGATISGGLTVDSGATTFAGAVTQNSGHYRLYGGGDVRVEDAGGDVRIAGGGHFYRGSANISNIPTCTSTEQKLSWSGTAWSCTNIGSLDAGDIDAIGTLTSGRWCRTNGTVIHCDRPMSISNNQVCRGNGSTGINCNLSNVTSYETDPQVGGLTSGRWCRTNGSAVICDRPMSITNNRICRGNGSTGINCNLANVNAYITAAGETDPQVGALTNGKWCQASGGQVRCTYDPPAGTTTTTTSGTGCSSCGCGCGINCGFGCTGGNCCDGDDDDADEAAGDLLWQSLNLPKVAQRIKENKAKGILH